MSEPHAKAALLATIRWMKDHPLEDPTDAELEQYLEQADRDLSDDPACRMFGSKTTDGRTGTGFLTRNR